MSSGKPTHFHLGSIGFLQVCATTAYVLLFAAGLVVDWGKWRQPPLPMPITVLTVFGVSAIVMVARLIYSRRHGLWANNRLTNEHVSIWSEAFIPERTAAVSLVIFGVMGIPPIRDLYQQDEVTEVLNALLVTGGLLAALITSPQHLPRLVKTVEMHRQALVNAWPANRSPHL